jgi:hypothetical protein
MALYLHHEINITTFDIKLSLRLDSRWAPDETEAFLSYRPLKIVWADLPTAVRVRVNLNF